MNVCVLCALNGRQGVAVVFLIVMHEGRRRPLPACELHRGETIVSVPLGGPGHDETLHVFEVVDRPTLEGGCGC